MSRSRRERPARLVLLLLVALAALAAGRSLARALSQRVALELLLGPLAWPLIGLCTAALLAALLALLRARGESAALPTLRLALGSLFVVAVTGWVVLLACVQPVQQLWFDLGLGLAAGAWCALLLTLGRWESPRLLRRARLLLALAVTLVSAELGLRALASLRPMPLLARTADAPRRTLERFRCAPGELRYGFACNARGFYDEPFAPRDPATGLVAVIGDSFGLGVVPHARHYTTVAEAELGVPLANLGVAGAGPPEYLALLADEALPLDPDTVVLALFVGNDLEFELGAPSSDLLRSVFAREQNLTWVLPGRLRRLAGVRSGAAAGALDAGVDLPVPVGLDDPLLEQPTLPPDAFLRLETRRALAVCAGDPPGLAALQHLLLEARALAGQRRLAVLLIPDEFQVSDELWDAVKAGAGRELERDRPQRLLSAWLAEQDIACLDLLPALRAVEPLADGRRHLYHLRDTHFNSRGNQAAGRALAHFLAELR